MNSKTICLTRAMILITGFALTGVPEMLAQTAATPAPAGVQSTQPTTTAPDASSSDSATPDPSRGPLQPSQGELPEAPSATQSPASSQSSSGQSAGRATGNTASQPEAPLGAAAAQAGPTAGGAASKPAGTAIAPAKQRQVRSLLIKVGAIAAAGIAVGTVYALSRGTSSTPPGAAAQSAGAR